MIFMKELTGQMIQERQNAKLLSAQYARFGISEAVVRFGED